MLEKEFIFCYVFSTYVEVILTTLFISPKSGGILHVCGGDPNLNVLEMNNFKYSPRMWR